MSAERRNVDIADSGLPHRLRCLRQERGWSKGDLADRAGLTWRAVHDIESGKRTRIQEHTLFGLARALGVAPDDLLGRSLTDPPSRSDAPEAAPPDPPGTPAAAPRGGARRGGLLVRGVAVASILPCLLAAKAIRDFAGAPVTVRAEGATAVVERRLLAPLRLGPHDSPVASVVIAPWRGHRAVLYSLGPSGEDGGTTFAVDAPTGRILWTLRPPYEQLAAVFGENLARAGSYGNAKFHHGAGNMLFGNVDGSGDEELILMFHHETRYPAYVDIVACDGTRIGSYLNWGHLYAGAVADLDDDGKDEVVVAGTTNASCYQGSTVILLDDAHCRGASVDSLVAPDCGVPDGSLARLVLPLFEEPFGRLLGVDRLHTTEVLVSRDEQGRPRIVVDVGATPANEGFLVTLDATLRPLEIATSDALARAVADWPVETRRAFLGPAHLGRWLAGHRYFGALARQAPPAAAPARESFAAPVPGGPPGP